MINRLPQEYSSDDPLASAALQAQAGRIPGLAPASEPFQQRLLSAAANSVGWIRVDAELTVFDPEFFDPVAQTSRTRAVRVVG